MIMNLKVLTVTKPIVDPSGKWESIEVAYKDLGNGKMTGKKLVSFSHPDVYKYFLNAKEGQEVAVVVAKDDAGKFWQWQSIYNEENKSVKESPDKPPVSTNFNTFTNGKSKPVSSYETAFERAEKQRLIVRQAAINASIAMGNTESNNVLEQAKVFEDWVYRRDHVTAFGDLESDIPE